MVYAWRWGGGGGRGNLRVAKTPPLQAAWAGIPLRRMPPTTICDHMGINGNGEWEGNDAVRRVVIKIIGPHRWVACGVHGMRMAAAMGRHLDRNGIPANADCRGAYHLRSAKISPPVLYRIRCVFPVSLVLNFGVAEHFLTLQLQ